MIRSFSSRSHIHTAHQSEVRCFAHVFAAAAVAASYRCAPGTRLLSSPANNQQLSSTSRLLLSAFSIETTPKSSKSIDNHASLLPPGTCVYVAAIPGTPLEDMVALCAKLQQEGLEAVPHMAARALADEAEVSEWVSLFSGVGVDHVLLLAGDGKKPAGKFTSSMDLLHSGLLHPTMKQIDVVGHPEGSGKIDSPLTHLKEKVDWAAENNVTMDILTQVCFNVSTVSEYCRHLRQQGIPNAIRVGLPGPTRPSTLLRYASACGVGPSIALLANSPAVARGLMAQNEATPNALLSEFSSLVDEDVRGHGALKLHLFSFGGVKSTAAWATRGLAP